MKATERITVKRSFCILFFLILVGTAGCTTNNNGGSPGNDSGVADGPVQVARDVQAQLADASPAYSGDAAMPDAIGATKDAAAPDAIGATNDVAQDSPSADAAVPDAASVAKDAVQDAPTADAVSSDVASVGKDAAQDAPDPGATNQCQLNADGTCSALTPFTSCTPFLGYRYDDGAGCLSGVGTTLGCCAGYCERGPLSGCYEVETNGGTVSYIVWNIMSSQKYIPPGVQACDPNSNASIHGVSTWICESPRPDAAVPTDAPPVVLMTPTLPAACTTDGDCCVASDYTCTAVAYLVGLAEYDSMVASIAKVNSSNKNRSCVDCVTPAIQVQCEGGFCVGKKLPYSPAVRPLTRSHCGYLAPLDAGVAPAVSPHAVVDSGTGPDASRTTWNCGSN
jgi:hypothetical protein